MGRGGGGRVSLSVGGGVRVDVNEEFEVFFVKIKKKSGGGWVGGGRGCGGQGGCERRIEVFVKIKKKIGGGGSGLGGGSG